MTEKRFKRYLLDGGFWFEEYVEPVWAITDRLDKNSPITHIEFKDEYKDLCDEVVKLLNELHEENENLKDVNVQCCNDYSAMRRDILQYKEENEQLKQRNDRQAKQLDNLYHLIEKQDWKTLNGLIQEFQECEEQLQREWRTYK